MDARVEVAMQLTLKFFDPVAAFDGKTLENRNIDLAEAAAEFYNTIYEKLFDDVTE